MLEIFYNIVGKECRTGDTSDRVTCPRTGDALWEAPLASETDLEDAVKSARAASSSWAATSVGVRQNLLRKFAAEITAQAAALSGILAQETGKSVFHPLTLAVLGYC